MLSQNKSGLVTNSGNDSDPGDEEINEYAELIGIDPDKEPQLMWIARQGITAPLPTDWKPVQTADGDLYFHNGKSGQSLWEHPSDQKFRQMVIDERSKKPQSASIDQQKPTTLSSTTKPPLGKLAPLAPLAPISRNSPILAPIAVPSRTPTPLTNPRPIPSIPSITPPPPVVTAAPVERPKTSRGPNSTVENKDKSQESTSPRKVLGGGSRFLKKADSVDIVPSTTTKADPPKATIIQSAEVLTLDPNQKFNTLKKNQVYASLGLMDEDSESEIEEEDSPQSNVIPSIIEKTKTNVIMDAASLLSPKVSPSPPAPVSKPMEAIVKAFDQKPPISSVPPSKANISNIQVSETFVNSTSKVQKSDTKEDTGYAKLEPLPLAPSKIFDGNPTKTDSKEAEQQFAAAEEERKRKLQEEMESRLKIFKQDLAKREEQEKSKIQSDHAKSLDELKQKLNHDKLKLAADFAEQLTKFKQEHNLANENTTKNILQEEKQHYFEISTKLQKENEQKFDDLKRQLENNLKDQTEKLEFDKEEKMLKLKEKLEHEFDGFKAQLENDIEKKKFELKLQAERSFIESDLEFINQKKRINSTKETANQYGQKQSPNNYMDQSLADLHKELEEMRRDLHELTGFVKELNKVDGTLQKPPMSKKTKVERKPKTQSKKKQKFIRSLDEFLTSNDEEQKNDPMLDKLETDDVMKKVKQFLESQNFKQQSPRWNDNSCQKRWSINPASNHFSFKNNEQNPENKVDEMIYRSLKQVFPRSNDFSTLFGSATMQNYQQIWQPAKRYDVETELKSLKNWLKRFEKDIK